MKLLWVLSSYMHDALQRHEDSGYGCAKGHQDSVHGIRIVYMGVLKGLSGPKRLGLLRQLALGG